MDAARRTCSTLRPRRPAAKREPGRPIRRAAASPVALPTTWSTAALRRARRIPARPRPLSATTATAPARHSAYTETVRSADGSTSRATRSPGRTPDAASPAATSATRAASSRQLTVAPPTSTTAGATSSDRSSSADHNRRTGELPGTPPGRSGAASAEPSSPTQRETTAAYSGASSGSRCDAPSKRCSCACGRRPRRSARYRSPKTGSRGPQSSRAGTSSVRIPSAIASCAAAGRMAGRERDVGDEVAHGPPPGRPSGRGRRRRAARRRAAPAGTAPWSPARTPAYRR